MFNETTAESYQYGKESVNPSFPTTFKLMGRQNIREDKTQKVEIMYEGKEKESIGVPIHGIDKNPQGYRPR